MPEYILFLLYLIFPFLVILGAVYDIYRYLIPNIIPLAIFFSFYIFSIFHPNIGWTIFIEHHIVFMTTFIIVFIFFIYNIFGGGDAKLIAASSLWIGSVDIFTYIVAIIFAGGILTFFVIYLRAQACYPLILQNGCLRGLYFSRHGNNNIPYAVSISMGTLFILPETVIYKMTFI